MEPEGAVRMAKTAQGYGVSYEELTTDADASTWAKLKQELPAEVYGHMVRQLDIKHLKGNWYDKLAKLKASKLSEKGSRGVLSKAHIEAWCHYLSYAVKSNKGDKEEIIETLRALPYHLFGDHSRCKKKTHVNDEVGWCKVDLEPDHIRIKGDKGHGGYMADIGGYQETMVGIFEHYCSPEMIDQIYKGSSDNRNESLHSTNTSISPKKSHFLRSGTYVAQVLARCLQKNWGQGWEKRVLEEVGVLYATDPKRPGSLLFEKMRKATKHDVESKATKGKKQRKAKLKSRRKKKKKKHSMLKS
jgi:hypothetical protein